MSDRPMVASSGFRQSPEPPLSGNALDIVLAHRHGHQIGQQISTMFCHRFFACDSGGCRGNTERILAQWQLSAASGAALNMLYWAIHVAWHPCACMALKMARNGGTSFVAPACFVWHSHS